MPLIQVTDIFNEPLDLWLSPSHEVGAVQLLNALDP
jgi:hypothetical protein